METREKLSKLSQIPVEELDKKLQFKEDKGNQLIIIKEELDRETFKNIAQAVQALGGQYVKTEKFFKLPLAKETPWEEVETALKSLPDDIKLSLTVDLIVKARSFMGPQKFRILIKQLKDIGGTYVPGKEQAHFELKVAIPIINPEKELVDRVQYGGLSAYQQALLMQELITKYNYSQEDLAAKLKRSRSWVANHMRLLQLKDKIPEQMLNLLSEGVARTLLSTPPDHLEKVAEEYVTRAKKGQAPSIAELIQIIKDAKQK